MSEITRPPGIICTDWSPLPSNPTSKRCEHYIDGGTCMFSGRFLCEEFERANKRSLPVVQAGSPPPVPAAPPAPAASPPAPAARPDGHHCHAHACTVPTKPELLMCGKHWAMVPKVVQEAVWAAYRPGQCDDKNPSAAWHEAADHAIAEVAAKEGYGAVALNYRKQAEGHRLAKTIGFNVCPDCGSPQWHALGSGYTCKNGHGYGDPNGPPERAAPAPVDVLAVDAPGSPDDGFLLQPPDPNAPKAPRGGGAAAKARAAWEAKLPSGRSITFVDPEPYTAAKEISPESLAALAAITPRVELDAGPLGKIALVAERSEDPAGADAPFEMTFSEAATLRLLLDTFPGARVIELKKKTEEET